MVEHCRKIFKRSSGDVTVRDKPPDIPYMGFTPVIKCQYISLDEGIGWGKGTVYIF